ncbi:hypothetical protein ACFX12_044590 [Malus domestica]
MYPISISAPSISLSPFYLSQSVSPSLSKKSNTAPPSSPSISTPLICPVQRHSSGDTHRDTGGPHYGLVEDTLRTGGSGHPKEVLPNELYSQLAIYIAAAHALKPNYNMPNLMLDDDAFLASVETQPHSPFGVLAPNESFATYQHHETCSGNMQSSGSTSLSATTRKKNMGVNRIRWGRGRRENLNFNRFGQAFSPRDNVARFGHYIAMLARDGGLILIDSLDWRKIDSSKLDRVWLLVQATIEWTNSRAAGNEEKVRGIVETKIHDRFRTWRAKLCKLYYVPFENSEQRKHCDDARVIQTQWQALVAHWDKMENKRRCATNAKNQRMLKTSHTTGSTTFIQIQNDYDEEHDGCEPDCVTFFRMTHTRGPKQLPEHAESARMMLAFENLEVEVCECGEGVTTEVRNRIYAEVLGPEKRNQVRGFGLGVG